MVVPFYVTTDLSAPIISNSHYRMACTRTRQQEHCRHQPKHGSGIELRQDLKAAGISVPVIYMTGNEDPAIRTAALDSGFIAFLTKPFSVQALMESLKKASAGCS